MTWPTLRLTRTQFDLLPVVLTEIVDDQPDGVFDQVRHIVRAIVSLNGEIDQIVEHTNGTVVRVNLDIVLGQ